MNDRDGKCRSPEKLLWATYLLLMLHFISGKGGVLNSVAQREGGLGEFSNKVKPVAGVLRGAGGRQVRRKVFWTVTVAQAPESRCVGHGQGRASGRVWRTAAGDQASRFKGGFWGSLNLGAKA